MYTEFPFAPPISATVIFCAFLVCSALGAFCIKKIGAKKTGATGLLAACAALVAVATSPTLADDTHKKSITIATIQNSILVAEKSYRKIRPLGFEKAIAAFNTCGLEAEFIIVPSWARAFQMASQGYVDGLIAANKTTAREKIFYFAKKPYTTVAILAFQSTRQPLARFKKWSIFDGKVLGYISGVFLSKPFENYIKQGTATTVQRSTMDILFADMLDGKIDFVIGQAELDDDVSTPLGSRKLVRALQPPLGISPLYIALSRRGEFAQDPTTPEFKCLVG